MALRAHIGSYNRGSTVQKVNTFNWKNLAVAAGIVALIYVVLVPTKVPNHDYQQATDGTHLSVKRLGESDPGTLSAVNPPNNSDARRVFRPRKRHQTSLEDLYSDDDALKERTLDGNANAAFALHQKLKVCATALPPMTEAEFETYLNRMHTTYEAPIYRNGTIQFASIQSASEKEFTAFVDHFIKQYDTCNDVGMDKRGKTREWLTIAIENGADWLGANLEYSRLLTGKEKEEYLLEMWSDGEPFALVELGNAKQSEFNSSLEEDDLIQSTGFFSAYVQLIHEAALQHPDDQNIQLAADLYQRHMDSVFWSIGPRQQSEAEEFARDLLDNNENCCFSPFFDGMVALTTSP